MVHLLRFEKLNYSSNTFYSHLLCNISNTLYANNDFNLKTNFNILSGFYQNVPSLKWILSNVHFNIVSLYHYNYFVLTKTWLINNINCNELGMTKFKVYDHNNKYLNSAYSRGGTFLIPLKICYCSNAITLFDPTFECLDISFKSGNFKIIFVSKLLVFTSSTTSNY